MKVNFQKVLIFFNCIVFCLSCKKDQNTDDTILYSSPDLSIEQVSQHVYLHVSYLETQDYGKVGCNGMIIADGNEAIILDTPSEKEASQELLDWVENTLNCNIVAVVPTHFHSDCLGGLAVFHAKGISSYANQKTIQFATDNGFEIPQNSFKNSIELIAGSEKVLCTFYGEGHTRDNIIAYALNDKVMFGGCLVKSLKAGKGNLADANIDTWSTTVSNIKTAYPDVKVVIPGHGKLGGLDLLDYTIQMFR